MGYVIPAGHSRVSFNYDGVSLSGSAPSFGFGTTVIPSQDAVDSYYDFWTVVLQPLTNGGARLLSITMRNDLQFAERLVGQNGGRSGDFQPPAVSALIKLSTGQAGRSKRGRIYLPFTLPDAAVDGGGVINSGDLADVQDVADGIAGFTTDLGGEVVVLHSTELAPTPVTSLVAQAQVATQRRRNRR